MMSSPVIYTFVNVKNKYSIEEQKKYIITYTNRIHAVMFLQILISYSTRVCVCDTVDAKNQHTKIRESCDQAPIANLEPRRGSQFDM
jgi:hypothetical protein